MEWLEFNRMSQEVEQQLAKQAARLSGMTRGVVSSPARTETRQAQARNLEALLRSHTRTNPWGHPPAEC